MLAPQQRQTPAHAAHGPAREHGDALAVVLCHAAAMDEWP
jgi:hypothetical protein